MNPVRRWVKHLIDTVIGSTDNSPVYHDDALYLAVTLDLEHLLMDNGLCLNSNIDSEVPLPETVLTQLVNILLDAWVLTLPPHFKSDTKIAQIRLEIAAGESAQKVHRMLRRLRQHGLFVTSSSNDKKVE